MFSTIKILLVEDEDLIRRLLSEAMEDDGFDVLQVATGDDALRYLLPNTNVDLLMTDLQLPGTLDGLDLAAAVRRHHPELPIIFTTGQPDRMGAWTTGAADLFIPKPYRPSQVCAAARRLIGR